MSAVALLAPNFELLCISLIFFPADVGQEGTCPTPEQRELAQQVVTASFNDFTVITNIKPIVDHPCGPGFWTQVAVLNLTDPTQQCPPAWNETITAVGRGCTRPESPVGTCLSTTYSTQGVEYTQVCGRIIGIQNTSTDAFLNLFANGIDGPYVDGVSLTHGMPRQHIWSFASGLQESAQSGTNGCFCGDSAITPGAPPPAFVGSNYFCESGNSEQPRFNVVYTEDPLWDGLDCPTNNCCEFNSPPWFNTELPAPTTDDIEVRLCCDQDTTDENIIVQFLELYVSSQIS